MWHFPAYKNVLVITTGNRIRIKKTGGAFVIPFIQKAYEIDLHPFYITHNEVYQTDDGYIRIHWTACMRPDEAKLQYILKNGYNDTVEEAREIVKRWVREVTSWYKRDDIVMEMRAFAEQVEKHVCKEFSDKGLEFCVLNLHDFSFQESAS